MVSGAEFSMPTFRGGGHRLLAIPKKNCFPKACSGRDEGLIPRFYFANTQHFKVTLLQNRDPVSIGDEIIDHLHLVNRERRLKRLNVYPPGKVCGDDHFLGDGSSYTKTGGSDSFPTLQEIDEDILQPLALFA